MEPQVKARYGDYLAEYLARASKCARSARATTWRPKDETQHMTMLETFAGLFEAKGESEWCGALFTLSNRFGFERTMFAVVPRPGMPLDEAHLHTTYAAEWRSAYVKQRMADFDPTVSHCYTRATPLLWSPGLFASKAQKQMYEEACGFGLRAGLTLPIHGPRGEVGMLCFVTDQAPLTGLQREMTNHLPDIALLRDVAFETCQPYLSSHLKSALPVLTSRERECLQWAAAGKSSWDIANILRCSEATVNFHMTNIRHKMGVSSRRAAAVQAARLGLISLG